ncbi:MAG: alpha/beta hydrolase [Burkholderiaceae bacterium]
MNPVPGVAVRGVVALRTGLFRSRWVPRTGPARFAAMALLLLAAGAPALGSEALRDCSVPGIKNSVRCGAVQRALDPARPDSPVISVQFVVIPALARRRLPDPVFLLAGGPGQSAISLAGPVLGLLARLGNRRDLVFVDQRGTGDSAPLYCEDSRRSPLAEQADPARQTARLQNCRRQLQALPHGDLRFFTTTLAMQDLDAVREHIGAERINLVGASYGTRAALEYQRQYPARVRRMVLDGVAPPDMVLPASSALDAQAALDALFADCAAQPACSAAHPRLRQDWASLLASVPRAVQMAHPLTGEVQDLTLTRDMLLASVRAPLYIPALASALPVAIAQAAQGRFIALLGLNSIQGARRANRIAEGMHYSVLCAEDFPRLDAAQPLAPDFGDSGLRSVARVCADWPRGDVPAAFYTVPTGHAPALLLSGGLDPATPPRHAERIAAALGSNARHVVVDHAGHGVLGIACMRDVLYRFIAAADDTQALEVDASCAAAIPRPPAFRPTAQPTEVRPG